MGFREIEIKGFAEANGPWFEKTEDGRLHAFGHSTEAGAFPIGIDAEVTA